MYTLNLLAAAAAKWLQLCPTLCDPIDGLYLKSLLFPLVRKYKGFKDFPCGSAGKEPTCNVGDLGLISGLGRSSGEGKGKHSNVLAWRIPWDRKESGKTELLSC